jgi:enamine deaminase RidA (YjgF/YER057c/UK114 family)
MRAEEHLSLRMHVPFDALWAMPIEVPYSLLVRDGALAWTCGQVALDEASRVLHPGDLVAQARCVCRYIDEILERGGLGRQHVGKLVVYHVAENDDERARMLDLLRTHFGATPLIVPVAVPYLYYDGLLTEIDVFASAEHSSLHRATRVGGRLGLELVDAGELAWATFTAPGDTRTLLESLAEPFVDDALASVGLSREDLLAEHWYVPGHSGGGVAAPGPLSDAGAMVMTGGAQAQAWGELTFVRGEGAATAQSRQAAGGVRITVRRKGRFAWVAARCSDPSAGLVEQTRRIMETVSDELDAQSLGFAHVVKATTHYAGSSAAADLHDNMAVRNARYVRPGPASTGLPVLALGDPDSRTAIDMVLVADA